MHTYDTQRFFKRNAQVILVLCWVIGLYVGAGDGVRSVSLVSNSLRMACRVGNSVLPLAALLPICFVWLTGYRSLRFLIYPVILIKAYFDGVVFVGVSASFGSAVWLVTPLLLLSDRVATICFIYLASQCVGNEMADLQRSSLCSFMIVLGAIILDILFVAPYLASIMS